MDDMKYTRVEGCKDDMGEIAKSEQSLDNHSYQKFRSGHSVMFGPKRGH